MKNKKTMQLNLEQQKLFNNNIDLAEIKVNTWIMAKDSYYTRGDLLTFAYQGLVLAAQTYNPDRGCSFRTYATKIIKHEILHGVEYYNKLYSKEDSMDMSQIFVPRNKSLNIGKDLWNKEINKLELDLIIKEYLSYCEPLEAEIFAEVIINDRSRTDVAAEFNISIQTVSTKVKEMQKEFINFIKQ